MTAGGLEIGAEEIVARHIEIAGVTDERLRAIMTPQYVGQDYVLEGYNFLRAVSEDRPAFPDFEVAVYAHRVVDAIYESARDRAAGRDRLRTRCPTTT